MNESPYELDELLSAAKIYLQSSGLKHFFKNSNIESEKIENEDLEKSEVEVLAPSYVDLDYNALKELASGCVRCKLCESRTNVVFGSGNTNSPLIAFVGEAPGAEEDFHAEPFVGKAGEFLTQAITKGLKLRREDVYITNAVKCRPPENRKPQIDEVLTCKPYLEQQLRLIKPKVIVCLGGTAQSALIGREEGITKLRGQWFEWQGIPVMLTVHPIYILKNPSAKRDFWEDLKMVMEKLGIES
jgi:DNA polymerase